MIIKGKTWILGDDINTDVIIPARFLNTIDPVILGQHCLEDLNSPITKKIQAGDILVAGENFGCGSSREHAPLSLKAKGIGGVIAKSFARIFFRNAINTGFPVFQCPHLVEDVRENDEVKINTEQGIIENTTQKTQYQIVPFPPFLQQIIQLGGLIQYLKHKKA